MTQNISESTEEKQKTTSFSTQYIQDLEEAFQAALAHKNYAAAVRAKELQAKAMEKRETEKLAMNKPITVDDLTDTDITNLLKDFDSFSFTSKDLWKKVKKYIQKNINLTK